MVRLGRLNCGNAVEDYQHCLVQPAGRIDRDLIVAEKASIDRIVATLGLKEMSQATLVRKLCALPPPTTGPARRSSSTTGWSAASTRSITSATRSCSATFTARRNASR